MARALWDDPGVSSPIATMVGARTVFDRQIEAFNARDLEALVGLFHEDVDIEFEGRVARDRAAVKEAVKSLWGHFAAGSLRVVRTIAESPDAVVADVALGDGGRRVRQVLRVREGRIVEASCTILAGEREVADAATLGEHIAAGLGSGGRTDEQELLRALIDEKAALRRVAVLVARGCGDEEVFHAVAREGSRIVEDEPTLLARYEGGRRFVVVASIYAPAPAGTVLDIPDDDEGLLATMLATGRPVRIDDFAEKGASYARDDYAVQSAVGVPFFVDDRLWGAMASVSINRRLSRDAERRVTEFGELVSAALANTQARSRLQRLVEEQSALRRVAELVARGGPADDLFASVAIEASRLMDGRPTHLLRFDDDDGSAVVVAVAGGPTPVGLRVEAADGTVVADVHRTRAPVRLDDVSGGPNASLAASLGIHAVVAVPVTVEGALWGMLATTSDEALPAGTEERLSQFADLVAAAIANAESRAQLAASRARVVAAADHARRMVQQEVHDGAQQRLTQTLVNLQLARRAAEDGGDPRPYVVEAQEQATEAADQLGRMVQGLLPATLSRAGLRAGLQSLVGRVDLPVRLSVAAPSLPAGVETTAYLVAAEALANAARHAHATEASVEVLVAGGRLTLTVGDDGDGGADPARGTGLLGLRDRVEAHDGRLMIDSPSGGGTRVTVVLPVPESSG